MVSGHNCQSGVDVLDFHKKADFRKKTIRTHNKYFESSGASLCIFLKIVNKIFDLAVFIKTKLHCICKPVRLGVSKGVFSGKNRSICAFSTQVS